MIENFNPDDFKLKPLQIVLYAVAMGALMFICLNHGFTLLNSSLMSLGVMILLIVIDYAVVGYLEKRQRDKEWEKKNSQGENQ